MHMMFRIEILCEASMLARYLTIWVHLLSPTHSIFWCLETVSKLLGFLSSFLGSSDHDDIKFDRDNIAPRKELSTLPEKATWTQLE